MTTLELTPHAPAPVYVATDMPGYAFQVELPDDWSELPIEPEVVDFRDPDALRTLARFGSADGALTLTVAMRPTYQAGTLSQWLLGLGAALRFGMGPIAPLAMGPLTAAECVASEAAPAGERWMHVALCEDGQTLFLLRATTAPELFDAIGPVLAQIVASFTLAAGRGQTVPVE